MSTKYLILLIISILNFIFINISIKKFLPIFEEKYIDIPNKRSIHKEPKPTGGGIFIVINTLFLYFLINILLKANILIENTSLESIITIISISCLIGLLGFLDDLYNIKSKFKFGFQVFLSILFIEYLNINMFNKTISLVNLNKDISILITYTAIIIVISGIINMINFMDGIDGLICGSFALVFLVLSLKINVFLLPLSMGLFSFLLFNWYPSIIFMGDAGSTFIGAIFAGLVISSETLKESLSIILLISPLLLDSSICLLRRLLDGQNIFTPHKLHLYQRLVDNKIPHDKVSTIYICSCLLISLFYLTDSFLLEIFSAILILIIGFYFEKNYAISFTKR